METEQRADGKRIEVNRLLEALDPGIGLGVQGYTKNLSNGGLRAYIDMAPAPGDLVELHIALADDAPPFQTSGEVVWCVPEANGEGAEVGLRFIDREDQPIEPVEVKNTPEIDEAKAAECHPSVDLDLAPGDELTVNAGGRTLAAIVQDVSPDGTLRIGLLRKVDHSALPDEVEIDLDIDYKAHPFRDTKNTVLKYAGPVLALIVAAFKFVGKTIARICSKARTRAGKGHLPDTQPLQAKMTSLIHRLAGLYPTLKRRIGSRR